MNRADPKSIRLRRQIEDRQRREAKEAAQRLLDKPSADPVLEAKKLDAYDVILAKLASGSLLKKLIPMVVALMCIIIVGALYGVQRSETKVLLELESETASLRLAEPLIWPGEMPIEPPVQMSGVNSINSMLFAQPLQSQHGDAWLEINQGKAALSELTLDKGGVMELDVEADRLSLYLNETVISGNLLVAGQTRLEAGSETGFIDVNIKETLVGPESLDFTADGAGAVPTILTLGATQSFTLYNVPVKGLAFVREVHGGVTAVHSISTITSGSISLPEVKEIVDLRPGERLALEGLDGRLTQLELGSRIKVQFEGTAKSIQLGPQGFERDLAPSWLVYLYNQEKLAFVWSAFLFLWGILWSIRKTVFT